MNIWAGQTSRVDRQSVELPPCVQSLAPRERELATAIYTRGPLTAEGLREQLSLEITNAAIRSMLSRLCRKGILKRRAQDGNAQARGQGMAFLYLPLITPDLVCRQAMEQLAKDFFEGSMLDVAQAAIEMSRAVDPARSDRASRSPTWKPSSHLTAGFRYEQVIPPER